MVTRFQPYKLLYNQPHPLCTFVYTTKEAAREYAIGRGLKDNEILIKEVYLEEDFILEFKET